MTFELAAALFVLALVCAYTLHLFVPDAALAAALAMLVVIAAAAYIAVDVLALRSGKLFAAVEVSLLLILVGVTIGVRLPRR